jgi:hypothetical protein
VDIITAVTALGHAIKITKDLRDIDRGLDAAAYKAKMADLYGTLADVKMALTDALEAIHDKDQELKELRAEIDKLKLGVFRVQERTLTCNNTECKHTELRNFDPDKKSNVLR